MDTLKQLKTGHRQRLPNPLAAKTGRRLRPCQRADLPDTDHFLITPRIGLALVEETDLLTLNLRGEIVDGNHPAPFEAWLHTAIMKAKPRVQCDYAHSCPSGEYLLGHRSKTRAGAQSRQLFCRRRAGVSNTGSDFDGKTGQRSGAGPGRQTGDPFARQWSGNRRQNHPRSGHDGDLFGGSGADALRRIANRHADSA